MGVLHVEQQKGVVVPGDASIGETGFVLLQGTAAATDQRRVGPWCSWRALRYDMRQSGQDMQRGSAEDAHDGGCDAGGVGYECRKFQRSRGGAGAPYTSGILIGNNYSAGRNNQCVMTTTTSSAPCNKTNFSNKQSLCFCS